MFYEGEIINGYQDRQVRSLNDRNPFLFIDVKSGKEEVDSTSSKSNYKEALHVKRVYEFLVRDLKLSPEQIGIITPYKAQKLLVRDLLKNEPKFDQNCVKIIESMQGREKDFIIFTCVRTSKAIGFLNKPNRINVALSRAKKGMIVIGKKRTL